MVKNGIIREKGGFMKKLIKFTFFLPLAVVIFMATKETIKDTALIYLMIGYTYSILKGLVWFFSKIKEKQLREINQTAHD